jgi:hypothetical protein
LVKDLDYNNDFIVGKATLQVTQELDKLVRSLENLNNELAAKVMLTLGMKR